jgi:ribosomal protein S18 acetylase RimI-like enzyme
MPDVQRRLLPTEWALRCAVVTPITERIERTYDAIPRTGGARVESIGPFEVFYQGTEGGWPLYARPRLGTTEFTPDDVRAARRRQRELHVPEAFEWVADVSPMLLPAVRATGLPVTLAPLMVLDPDRLPDPASLTDADLVLLHPDSDEFIGLFAASGAVANLAFATAGTAIGAAGPGERDAAILPTAPERLERSSVGIRSGRMAETIARTPFEGVVARGAYQGAEGAAEIVGVATLPSARRRGLGAAVSALAARHALESGYDLVFLSAANEDVARVYARIGFDRVGTSCIAEAPDGGH